MKFGVSQKTRLLFLLLLSIAGVIATLTFFIISSETDRFKIFMRGLMLCVFLGFSVSYCIDYIKELKKTSG